MSMQPTTSISTERTHALLRSSLFTLLLVRPFEKISLTDICRQAMIPRSTFYRHFHDKYDLLHHSFDFFVQQTGLTIDIHFIVSQTETADFFYRLLNYLQQNKATYRRLMISHRQDSVFECLQGYLEEKFYQSIQAAYPATLPNGLPPRMFSKIVASFIISVGKSYLESDEAIDISDIAYRLSLCTNDGFLP